MAGMRSRPSALVDDADRRWRGRGDRRKARSVAKRFGLSDLIGPVATRLPFFYGWVLVAVAFVTMAVAVNARTAFSLLFPPVLDEFGWDGGSRRAHFPSASWSRPR